MTKFTEVTQEVIHIAEELISQHHPLLRDCKIGFVFRDEAGKSGGKVVLAKCNKVPENLKPHLQDELDILIVISEDQWSNLEAEQRRALIDHEMCHLAIGPSGWTTRAHDIEEFGEIIQRYGLWNGDLFGLHTTLARAVQLELSITSVKQTPSGAVITIDPQKWGKVSAELGEETP